jgi:hypothetical protein
MILMMKSSSSPSPAVLCALLAVLILASSSSLLLVNADTVYLADCPQEPEVVGTYYNNGRKCVRDREVLSREVIAATCSDGYEYRKDRCRKRFHAAATPSCPEGYQRYTDECHKTCPTRKHKPSKGRCSLPRNTLPTKYMKCEEGQHRYQAYCCTMGVDCPKVECIVGADVPGRFTLEEDGVCRRSPQSIARVTSLKPRFEPCPSYKVQVWGVCQDPCPSGFQTSKGRCEIRGCEYDPHSDDFVRCPEGGYPIAKAMV